MKRNEFKLLGRVGEVDIDFKENGLTITTIRLGVSTGKKNDEGKTMYDNYYISFFKERAEKVGEQVQEGDYIQVTGSLSVNKYTPKNEEKPRYSIRLLGWGFNKVIFDTNLNKFVEAEPQTGEAQIDEDLTDEIPF